MRCALKRPSNHPAIIKKTTPEQGEEEDHAAAVENEVYERRPLGVLAAGDTGQDCNHAGADVGTHRKEYTLIELDESGDHHR